VLNVRRKRLNEALIKRSVRRKLTRLGKVLEQGDWVRVEQHALSQVRAIGDIAARARRQKLSLFRFSEEVYQINERRQTGRNVVFQQEGKETKENPALQPGVLFDEGKADQKELAAEGKETQPVFKYIVGEWDQLFEREELYHVEDPTTLVERDTHYEDLTFGKSHNAEEHLRRLGAARREDRERAELEYDEAEGVDVVVVESGGPNMVGKSVWLPSALEGKPPGGVRSVRVAAGNKVAGKVYDGDVITRMKALFNKKTAQLYYWNGITTARLVLFEEIVETAKGYVGQAIEKAYGDVVFKGKVTSYAWNDAYKTPNRLPGNAVLFHVRYSDGDSSDYNQKEIEKMLT
jgi:hypothetical protein